MIISKVSRKSPKKSFYAFRFIFKSLHTHKNLHFSLTTLALQIQYSWWFYVTFWFLHFLNHNKHSWINFSSALKHSNLDKKKFYNFLNENSKLLNSKTIFLMISIQDWDFLSEILGRKTSFRPKIILNFSKFKQQIIFNAPASFRNRPNSIRKVGKIVWMNYYWCVWEYTNIPFQ